MGSLLVHTLLTLLFAQLTQLCCVSCAQRVCLLSCKYIDAFYCLCTLLLHTYMPRCATLSCLGISTHRYCSETLSLSLTLSLFIRKKERLYNLFIRCICQNKVFI